MKQQTNLHRGVSGPKVLQTLRDKGFQPTRNKELMQVVAAYDSLKVKPKNAILNTATLKAEMKRNLETSQQGGRTGGSTAHLRASSRPRNENSMSLSSPLMTGRNAQRRSRSSLPAVKAPEQEGAPPTLRPSYYRPHLGPDGNVLPLSPVQDQGRAQSPSQTKTRFPPLSQSMLPGVPGRGGATRAAGTSPTSIHASRVTDRALGETTTVTFRRSNPRYHEVETSAKEQGFSLSHLDATFQSTGSWEDMTAHLRGTDGVRLSSIPILDSKKLPPVWVAWVRDCFSRGVEGEIILNILTRHGFNPRANPSLTQALLQEEQTPVAVKRSEIRDAIVDAEEKKLARERAKQEKRLQKQRAVDYARRQGMMAGYELVDSDEDEEVRGDSDEEDKGLEIQPLSYKDRVLAKALAQRGGGDEARPKLDPTDDMFEEEGLIWKKDEEPGTFHSAIMRGDEDEVERFLIGGAVS